MAKYSRIIQGCMHWGIWGKNFDTSGMVDMIHHCIDSGITTFDHADIYGDYTTEEAFGKAFAKADINRADIQLISKCGIQYKAGSRPENKVKHYQYDAQYIINSAERSLRLLQTEYLDLLLLHRPSPLMQPDEIAKAVEHLTKQGKISAFGLSNFTPSQTEVIRSSTAVDVNQIEISLTRYQPLFDGSLDHMQTQNITPMSWSPLGSFFKEDNAQQERIDAVLTSLTSKYDLTKDQLLLVWLLQHPSNIHPVIGTATQSRITAAAKVSETVLELQDWFALLVASQGHKVP